MRWLMTWWEKIIATIFFAFKRGTSATESSKPPLTPEEEKEKDKDTPYDKHEGEGN